nr:methyl-accepting chemotaxis protein [Paenibacillus dendrobii]
MLPIRNEGKVIAVLGIDYSAAYINDAVSASRTKQIIITLVGIAITGLIIYYIVHRLLRPLRNIVRMANKIADGDLSTQDFTADSKDEIGQLFNAIGKMNTHLRSLIQNIQEQSKLMMSSSEQLKTGASETESYSLSVTKNISEVAEQTTTTSKIADDTVTVLEETALGIQRIAESTSSASEESNQMADDAEAGHKVLQEMMNQMEAINTSVGQISRVLHNLNVRITEIGTFTDLITEVSQQTNLLSLNASIEAARAGEHGAGFAVVASEIRKLAESTSKSAAGISDLVSRIQDSTNDSLNAAEHGQQEATHGMSLATEAGQAFNRILSSTSNVAMQMQEISASLEQISASSEEATASVTELKYAAGNISRTSGQVSEAASKQLDFIQEISKSSQSLNEVSRQLQDQIMVFKVK